MSFENDVKELEDTHRAEKELFRAKEWFWQVNAEIKRVWGVWTVTFDDGTYRRVQGETKIETLLDAYRKAQEMEGEDAN